MTSLIIRYAFNFILIIGCQLLIFDNVFFLGYINPYIYLLFLISLPIIKSNKNLLLIVGFLTGLFIDAFHNSMGLHAFSCVLLMYLKEPILLSLIPQLKNKSQNNLTFSIQEYGIPTATIYTTSLVFIHHFSLFLIEAFRFDLLNVLLRTLVSSVITSIVLIIFLILNNKKQLR